MAPSFLLTLLSFSQSSGTTVQPPLPGEVKSFPCRSHFHNCHIPLDARNHIRQNPLP